MKEHRYWGGVILILTIFVLAITPVPTFADTHRGLPLVRLIVKYRPTFFSSSRLDESAVHEGVVVDRIPQLNVLVIEVPRARAQAAIQAYRTDPDVMYVEEDTQVVAAFTPNDPEFNLHQYSPQIIQADKAWDITTGQADILVAVVDTGADMNHPDLQNKVLPGWDFVNDDNDPSDDNGHGTHVTGIIAAATNNGVGIAGIGYNTRVMAVKVLSSSGAGYYSKVAQGITYAADHGARIINLSLRGTVDSSLLKDAVDYAWNKGSLIVAAAGNDGSDAPVYPAAYDHVVAVSATDWDDRHWSASNYGDYVDLAAPGVGIYSTDWEGGAGPYASRSGTSMASPHVAAVAALMLSVNPNLTNQDLENLLESSAVDLGEPGWDPLYGYGRVDAYQAVQAAQVAGGSGKGATIGDYVWEDANGNGIQDDDETGIAGVRVELYSSAETLFASTQTDEQGHYTFSQIPAGDYFVHVVIPNGYAVTRPNAGDDTQDSDVERETARTPLFTVQSGDTADNWDIGLVPTGRIGGIAWVDPNGNAVQDASENTPIQNVPIHITGTNVLGDAVDITTSTASDGRYLVENLLPGTYSVEAPYQISGYVRTSPSPQTFSLSATLRENQNINFGYIAPTWVTISRFTARVETGHVHLRWSVSIPLPLAPAFDVWRSRAGGKWHRLTSRPIAPTEQHAQGAAYEFVDTNIDAGATYLYLLTTPEGGRFGPWAVNVPAQAESRTHLHGYLPYLAH